MSLVRRASAGPAYGTSTERAEGTIPLFQTSGSPTPAAEEATCTS